MAGYPRSDIDANNWQTTAPDDWSWLDHLKAYGSDARKSLGNLGSNLIDGISPFHPNATQHGQPSLQVPPMIQGIADSYSRLAGTPSKPGNAYDLTGVPELDAPIQQDMSNVLLSLYGGNAAAGLVSPKPAPVQTFNGFHGSPIADGGAYAKSRGKYWASSNPEVADEFALRPLFEAADKYSPNVEPAQFNFKNPLIVGDGSPRYWAEIPFDGELSNTDMIAHIAKTKGHDGVVFRNIEEGGMFDEGADTYVALQRGTVTSPLTGETLFSDTGKPSLLGSALATAGEQPRTVKAYHSTPAQFDKFDNAFTDELGFHFGSKNQAHNRAYVQSGGNPLEYFFKWRDIPVEMDIKKAAQISGDVGKFDGPRMAQQLVRDGIAPYDLIASVMDAPKASQNGIVRDWLVNNGYDAVKYPNTFEGVGDPSYMALGTGNVRHAKTGQVLYSDGVPVPQNQQSDYDLTELLRRYGVSY